MSPDLILRPEQDGPCHTTELTSSGDKSSLSSNIPICDVPGIVIKFEREDSYDIDRSSKDEGFKQLVKPDGRTDTVLKKTTTKQHVLIDRMLHYVVEQWVTLPYRFLFSITICGEHLRI
jgi:hypothetical protein